MEELFAHNLHSEDKGLKNQMGTAATFVVYWEIRTEQHCEECLYTAWQIAYMGFKASSRKIPRDTFSKKRSLKKKKKKKQQEMKKVCCIFRPLHLAFTDLTIITLIPKKYNTGNGKTLQKSVCGAT